MAFDAMWQQRTLSLIVVLALATTTACLAPTTPTHDRVVVGVPADVAGLNPLLSTDPQSTTVTGRIYSSLLSHDARTGEPRPELAESWSIAPDNSSVRFTLRDNVQWSDGSPLTADDAAFTLAVLMRSRIAPHKEPLLTEIAGARAFATGEAQQLSGVTTAGRELNVQLTEPVCTAVEDIGQLPILPGSVFGKYLDPSDIAKTIDGAPENNAPPLSSGPFRFAEWVPNEHVTLVRNPHYFRGPARLDEWVYRVVPSSLVIPAQLQAGEIDVAQVYSPTMAATLEATGAFDVYDTPATGYWYIAWNQLRAGKEFFRDKAVRQALSYGLDWDQIIATTLQGHAQRVTAHTPPASWAFDPSGLNPYDYDPSRARQLLVDDGWTVGSDGIFEKDGQRLAFTLMTNPESTLRTAIVQIAAEQYHAIGVDVTPTTEAFEAFLQRTISSRDPVYGDQGGRDVDAYLIGWGQIGPDPDALWYWHSSELLTGGNRVGYRNPEVDRALEDGRSQCAQADRKAAYRRMDLQLNEDQPVSFGFIPNTVLAVSRRIKGVAPGPYSYLAQWNVEQWSRVP